MWYGIIIGLSGLAFFLSPYEPLLQASNRERIPYRTIAGKFPLFSGFRIAWTVILTALSCALLHLVDGPYFLGGFVLFFAVLYAYDFLLANRIAKEDRP